MQAYTSFPHNYSLNMEINADPILEIIALLETAGNMEVLKHNRNARHALIAEGEKALKLNPLKMGKNITNAHFTKISTLLERLRLMDILHSMQDIIASASNHDDTEGETIRSDSSSPKHAARPSDFLLV